MPPKGNKGKKSGQPENPEYIEKRKRNNEVIKRIYILIIQN